MAQQIAKFKVVVQEPLGMTGEQFALEQETLDSIGAKIVAVPAEPSS